MKQIKKSIMGKALWIILVMLLLAGCSSLLSGEEDQSPPTQPPATNTTAPTDTQAPTATNTPEPTVTNTPEPTATDTPVPTDTPDLAATASAEAEAAAAAVEASIKDELAKLGITLEKGELAWVQTEPIKISFSAGGGNDSAPFAEEMTFSDFILKADMVWNSETGFAGCGIIFRSEPNFETADQYQFNTIRVSGLPLWDMELWLSGQYVMTLGGRMRSNGAINQENGSTNTYVIVAEKDLFTAYANGEKMSRLQNSKLIEGIMGILVFQESGVTTCEIKNAWIWSLK